MKSTVPWFVALIDPFLIKENKSHFNDFTNSLISLLKLLLGLLFIPNFGITLFTVYCLLFPWSIVSTSVLVDSLELMFTFGVPLPVEKITRKSTRLGIYIFQVKPLILPCFIQFTFERVNTIATNYRFVQVIPFVDCTSRKSI
jgi:hypothetical protein